MTTRSANRTSVTSALCVARESRLNRGRRRRLLCSVDADRPGRRGRTQLADDDPRGLFRLDADDPLASLRDLFELPAGVSTSTAIPWAHFPGPRPEGCARSPATSGDAD
jgi:hypothetical protein